MQQTLRVDTAGVEAKAASWGAAAADLSASDLPATRGLSCQLSTAAVNAAHGEVTAFAAALAARVYACGGHVVEAGTHYIDNEIRSADQLAAVTHPVTQL